MSCIRTNIVVVIIVHPIVIVKSRLITASTASEPTPRHVKTASMIAEPPIEKLSAPPIVVRIGIHALPRACFLMTAFSGTPLARAVRR